jgi:hypothetical protein
VINTIDSFLPGDRVELQLSKNQSRDSPVRNRVITAAPVASNGPVGRIQAVAKKRGVGRLKFVLILAKVFESFPITFHTKSGIERGRRN